MPRIFAIAGGFFPATPRYLAALALCLFGFAAAGRAQTPPATPAQEQKPSPATDDPDGKIVDSVPQKPKTPEELKTAAWALLADTVQPDKRAESQVQALAALGSMGGSPRSLEHDPQSDGR